MRTITALILLTLSLACSGNAPASAPASVALNVEGMTCGACATSVRVVLEKLDGVAAADVSYADKRAVVQYDPALVSPSQMVTAIESKLSYEVRILEDQI